jgi:hypothetical protein
MQWMIALSPGLRGKLAARIERNGVVDVRTALECDEQTMMRAAVGVPLRDDVAKRIAAIVERWKKE